MKKITLAILISLFPLSAISVVSMTARAGQFNGNQGGIPGYELTLAVSNGTSSPIKIQSYPEAKFAGYTVKVASNTCYVEYTLCNYTEVTNNTAYWIRTGLGVVSTNGGEGFLAWPSFIRLVGLTNIARIDVVVQ